MIARDTLTKIFLQQWGKSIDETNVSMYSRTWWQSNRINKQNANARLADVARTEGAIFLGPLEKYSPELNRGDGIHPGPQGAKAMYRAVKGKQ